MAEPAKDDLLVVGKITGCYGVKGWVKIHSYTEPQENFLRFGKWKLQRKGAVEPIEFEDGRAVRKPEIVQANATYTFGEWTIFNDTGVAGTTNQPQNAPEDFTPGVRN